MKKSEDMDDTTTIALFGVIGALLGIGLGGTFQAACLGAGIGALVPIVLIILSVLT